MSWRRVPRVWATPYMLTLWIEVDNDRIHPARFIWAVWDPTRTTRLACSAETYVRYADAVRAVYKFMIDVGDKLGVDASQVATPKEATR